MKNDLICTWLRLPAGSWPPDHYRLLGLKPGEPDLRRIEQRAHELLDEVRRYQLMHPGPATEALNCLARAYACLTDPPSKRAYDAALLGPPAKVPVATAPPELLLPTSFPDLIPLEDEARTPDVRENRPPTRKAPEPTAPASEGAPAPPRAPAGPPRQPRRQPGPPFARGVLGDPKRFAGIGLVVLALGLAVGTAWLVLASFASPPNVEEVGGTRITFAIDREHSGSADVSEIVALLRRRLDAGTRAGISIRPVSKDWFQVDVPLSEEHDARVRQVCRLVPPRGELEFRAVANETDDAEALTAFRTRLEGHEGQRELSVHAARGEPPPAPSLPGRPGYAWVRLTAGAVSLLGLDPGGPVVRDAISRSEPFPWPELPGAAFFGQQTPGEDSPSLFVLTRISAPDKAVTERFLEPGEEGAAVDVSVEEGGAVRVKLNAEGEARLLGLAGGNAPGRRLAVVADDKVLSFLEAGVPAGGEVRIPGPFGPGGPEELARVLRVGVLPARLRAEPVKVKPFPSRS